MRKAIPLVLFILAAGLFPACANASHFETCLPLKSATKGLFGLCLAYHYAERPRVRDRILQVYNWRAREGDPPMPGTGSACPCFGETELAAAGLNHDAFSCGISESGSGISYADYDFRAIEFNVNGNLGSCYYSRLPTAGDDSTESAIADSLSDDEIQACRDLIDGAIQLDFTEIECEETP